MEGLIVPVRTTELEVNGQTVTAVYFEDNTTAYTTPGDIMDSAVTVVDKNCRVERVQDSQPYEELPHATRIARMLLRGFEETGEVDIAYLALPHF